MQLIIFRATQFRRIHLLQSSSTCSTLLRMVLTLARPGSFFTYHVKLLPHVYILSPRFGCHIHVYNFIYPGLVATCQHSLLLRGNSSLNWWLARLIQINPMLRDEVNLQIIQGKEFMKRSPGSISKSDPSTVPAVDLTGVANHFSFESISY